jgi:hypothetical protein
MAPDSSLLAYVQALEARLGQLRGRDHALSGPDFALARAWFQADIPVAWIVECIDQAQREGTDVNSLSFCRGRVEALARDRRR